MNVTSFLKLQKILAILVGQWRFENVNTFTKIYNIFSNVLLYLFTFCTHYLILPIFLNWNCKKAVTESIFYYVHFIIAIILTILLKSSSIQKYLQWIIKYENSNDFKDKEEVKIYKKYSKMNNMLTIFFIVCINIVSWMWYILGKRDSLKVELDPNCPIVRGNVFQIWYPFDVEKYSWICGTFDRVTVFCGMMLFCYYKIIPFSLIIFLLGQISLLKYAVKNINTLSNIGDNSTARIKRCLRMHQHCIGLMHWIQYSLKEIIVIQYFSYVLDTVAFMIPTLTEDSLQMQIRCFAGFIMTVFQMYFFFWFANEIQEESLSVSDIIYNNTNWIDAKVTDKKMLLIMMIRSQRKMSLKAAVIGEMSLNSFTKIMRICYSTVTFFTTMVDV